jgi:hypothetical protein
MGFDGPAHWARARRSGPDETQQVEEPQNLRAHLMPVEDEIDSVCRFSSRPSVVSWLILKNLSQVSGLQSVHTFTGKNEGENAAKVSEDTATCLTKRRRQRNSPDSDKFIPSECKNIIEKNSVSCDVSNTSISAATPSYCRQLLSKKVENPNGGPPLYPFVIQMLGSSSPFYIGCPVEVRVEGAETPGGWVKGMISSTSSSQDSKLGHHVLLNDGSIVFISDLEKLIRPDHESCGRFAVGRHVQVLFEGGTWYVGVVVFMDKALDPSSESQSHKRGRKRRGMTVLRVVFEDGDRLEVMAGDSSVMLLPTEWSDHIAETGNWGWWGYNKDRVQHCLDVGKEPWTVCLAPAKGRQKSNDVSKRESSEPRNPIPVKKQRRELSRAQDCQNSSGSVAEAISLFQTLVANPWEPGSCVHSYLMQMRGSNFKYYVGCPVDYREADQSNWEKGTVVVSGSDSDKLVGVVLRSGRRVQVDAVTGDGKHLRPDISILGKFALGRHAQVLFEDGFWYVGIVVGTFGAGREPSSARIRFEDGEEVEVSIGEKDVMLLPQEWSDVVAAAGTWGWWGYNVDRVKMCRVNGAQNAVAGDSEPLKTSLKRKVTSKILPGGGEQSNMPSAAVKQVGTRVKRRAVAIAPPAVAPPAPTGIARLSSFMHIQSPGLKGPGVSHAGQDDSDSDDSDGDDGQLMSPVALAVTLCDSLRIAAFVDGWDDCAPRTKWKERICKYATDWKHFAAQIRVFEGKIARSATIPAYAAARQALLEALGEVTDEELARHCVQLLAGVGSSVHTLVI